MDGMHSRDTSRHSCEHQTNAGLLMAGNSGPSPPYALSRQPISASAVVASTGTLRVSMQQEMAVNRFARRNPSLLLLSLTVLAFAAPSHAHDRRFERHHPRRDQVLDRTQRQNRRITHEVREGDMTRGQARALRATDRSIAQQQRADARANGGYITRQEQYNLNQELNANSQQIGH